MWLFLSLWACNQQEQQVSEKTDQGVEVTERGFQVLPDADLEEYLNSKFKYLQIKYGKARIAGKGPLVDEGWCHDYFHYSFVISRLIGLDFVKLASIQARKGVSGVNKVVDRYPNSEPQYQELQKIRQLIDLTDTEGVKQSYELFRQYRKPNLSDQEQIELWLNLFYEGYKLRSGTSAPEEFLPEDFPRAHEVSKLATVDFQQLAFIELKGGVPALLLLIRTIPFWTHREECFEVLQAQQKGL
jgi:hypothetical protein